MPAEFPRTPANTQRPTFFESAGAVHHPRYLLLTGAFQEQPRKLTAAIGRRISSLHPAQPEIG
jgi:hypothetical protein